MPIRYLSGVNVDSNTLVVDAANDRVGIATSTPSYKLDIAGVTRFQSNVRFANNTWNLSDDGYQRLYFGTNGRTYFGSGDGYEWRSSSDTALAVLTNGGNVGIGTTSPSVRLHVSSSSSAQIRIEADTDNVTETDVAELLMTQDGAITTASYSLNSDNNLVVGVNSTTAPNIYFATRADGTSYASSADAKLTILNGGNVGIGNTTPGAVLTIGTQSSGTAGTGVAQDNSIVGRFGAANTAGRVTALTIANTATPTVGNDATLSFIVGGNYSATGLISSILQNTSTARTDMAFSVYNVDGNYERMRITGGGNVGIGTTEPSTGYGGTIANVKLALRNGTVGANNGTSVLLIGGDNNHYSSITAEHIGGGLTYLAFGTSSADTNPTEKLRITASGNVGIGLTSPNTKLHLFGSGDQAITIQSSTTASSASSFVKYIRATTGSARTWWTGVGIQGGTDDSLSFYDETAGAERMRISSAGALKLNAYGSGSNTGTATQRLAVDASGNVIEIPIGSGPVDGNGTANYVTKWSDADTITNSIIYDNGTNVGIGTAGPGAKLHVSGSTYIRNDNSTNQLTIDNDSVGSNAAPQYSDVLFGGYSSTLRARIRGIDRASSITRGGIILQASTDGTTLVDRLFLDGNGESYFYNNSSEVMRITSAGNVGIGTTSPASILNTSGANSGITHDDSTTGKGYIRFRNSGTQLSLFGVAGAWEGSSLQDTMIAAETGLGIRLYTNGTAPAKMVVTSAGNVGIGTNSPMGPLEVYKANTGGLGGHIILNNNGQAVGNETAVLFNDSGVGSVSSVRAAISSSVEGSPYYGDLKFKTGATSYGSLNTRMIITGAGNVGIGTTSPLMKLDIYGTSGLPATSGTTPVGSLRLHASNNAVLDFGSDNGTAAGWIQSTDQADLSQFYGLLLNPRGGNVGIGTTSPDIYGFGGKVLSVNGGTSYTNLVLAGDADSGIAFGTSSARLGQITMDSTNGMRIFSTGAGDGLTMILNRSGNVGIGTTNPTRPLHVIGGDSGSGTHIAHFEGRFGVVGMYIRGDGNVGIGTTAPQLTNAGRGNVTINGSSDSVAVLSIADAWKSYWYVNGPATYFSSQGNRPLYFETNGGVQMGIDGSGNVGIGTTSPSYKLHVEGSTYVSSTLRLIGNMTVGGDTSQWQLAGVANGGAIWQKSNSGAGGSDDRYLRLGDIDNNGVPNYVVSIHNSNVGIGTTSPSVPLHVIGNILVTGTSPTFSGGALEIQGTANAVKTLYINRYGVASGSQHRLRAENAYFEIASANSEPIALIGGNVGINTTGPKSIFDVTQSTPTVSIVSTLNSEATADNQTLASITFYKHYGIANGAAIRMLQAGGTANYAQAHLTFLTTNDGNPYTASLYERMRITEAGNVGIGTTAPGARLTVQTSTASSAHSLRITDGTGDITIGHWDAVTNRFELSGKPTSFVQYGTGNYISFGTLGSENIRIQAGGNVGIGTTSPLQKLHVSAGHIVIENTYALYVNGSDYNWGFGRNIVTDSGFLSGNTLQAKVFNGTTQGFQVVNSSNTALFEVEGNTGRGRIIGGFAVGSITPSTTAGRIDASNDVVAYSTSDQRLKENITPIANALDKVKSLTGVEFDWKQETKHVHGYEGHDVGVIAQEVQAVLPEAIRTNDSGYLSVRYEKMIALLIEANKELASEVEQLKTRLDGLTK